MRWSRSISSGHAPSIRWIAVRKRERIRRVIGFTTTNRPAGVVTGIVSAIVVQSSSVVSVMLVGFVTAGLMSLAQAVNVLVGANIGTTATAWLASIGASAGAKRTALSNTLMNVIGTIAFLPLALTVFAPFVRSMFPSAFAATPDGLFPRIMMPIAVVDTLFSFLRAVIILPFARPFARLVERMIPERAEEKPHLSVLESNVTSPVIACEQALVEIAFMAESLTDMLAHARQALAGKDVEESERHVCRREDVLDNVQREVTVFIGRVMSPRISSATARLEQRILRLADVIESASDEIRNIVKALRRLREAGTVPQGGDLAAILEIHDRIESLAQFTPDALRTGVADMKSRLNISEEIKDRILEARRVQILRVGVDEGDGTAGVLAELDLLNAYNRLRGLCISIASEGN